MKFEITKVYYPDERSKDVRVVVRFEHPDTSTIGTSFAYDPYKFHNKEGLLKVVKEDLREFVKKCIEEDRKSRKARSQDEIECEDKRKMAENLRLLEIEGEHEVGAV